MRSTSSVYVVCLSRVCRMMSVAYLSYVCRVSVACLSYVVCRISVVRLSHVCRVSTVGTWVCPAAGLRHSAAPPHEWHDTLQIGEPRAGVGVDVV